MRNTWPCWSLHPRLTSFPMKTPGASLREKRALRARAKGATNSSGAKSQKLKRKKRRNSNPSGLDSKQIQLLRSHVSSFVTLYKKTQEIRLQGERLREMDKPEQDKMLIEATARLETEAKRNRFFTLP